MNEENNKILQLPDTKAWTRDLQSLPPFSHDLLQKHLITETQADNSATGAYKHKKLGYQLFKDRYVKQVQVKSEVKKDGNQVCYLIKGTVHASMKRKSYVVYVHLNQATGDVVYGNCSCKAGKGGCCKHVAALLFQILDYIQLELTEVPDDPTCIQLLQQWHVPRSDETDEAMLFEDLSFEKASYEKDNKGRKHKIPNREAINYNPTPHFARELSHARIEGLAHGLEQAGEASYLSKLLESNNCQPIPYEEFHSSLPSKRKFTESQDITCRLHDTCIREQMLENLKVDTINRSYIDENNIAFVEENLGATHDQILEIERNTRDQSDCAKWYEERKLRLTASNFGAVLKRRKQNYPKSLLDKLQSQSPKQRIPAPCKWGKDNEDTAIKAYLNFKEQQNQIVKVCSSCGLVVNRTSPWLGASPDFLISDTQEASPLGIGEIKCPYSKRELSIKEACEDLTFYLGTANGKVNLKQQHVYYYQLQGTMATLKVQWTDFIVYTSKDLHVERVYFDSDFWEKVMLPELTNFYFTYILPSLRQ